MTRPTFEKSHKSTYLTRTRPSDLQPVDVDAKRDRDHHADGRFKAGNRAGLNWRNKHAVTKSLREARNRLREALSSAVAPSEADRLLDASLRRYDAARRDLGAESVLVLSPLERWAVNEELVSYAQAKAGAAGFDTTEGARWLDRAHLLEARAERAMAAAMAAAGVLGTTRAKKQTSTTSRRDAIKARAAELAKGGT